MSKKKKKNKDAENLSSNINYILDNEEDKILKKISIIIVVMIILTLICYFVEI